jgi:ribosomal protein S6E (S10)
MPFKVNIGIKEGKTFKVETDSENLIGKRIGESFYGEEISPNLSGYEFEITGTSDKAGFPGLKDIEGAALKKVLLTYGPGMRETRPKGLRVKKSVRGNAISKDTAQINVKVKTKGAKKLEEIFPEQVKAKEEKTGAPVQAKPEEKK